MGIRAVGGALCRRAAVVLGEPDPFKLKYRDALRAAVAEVVRGRMDRKTAVAHVTAWAAEHVEEGDREKFRRLPRASCWAFTRATSRAMPSGGGIHRVAEAWSAQARHRHHAADDDHHHHDDDDVNGGGPHLTAPRFERFRSSMSSGTADKSVVSTFLQSRC